MLHLNRSSGALWLIERGILHLKPASVNKGLMERGKLHLKRQSSGLWLIERGILHLKSA